MPRSSKHLPSFTRLKQGPEAVTKRFTVRTVELDLKARTYTAEEVKKVRDLLGLSQPLFARFLGVSVQAVHAWENGGKIPSEMARRFLDEIALKPEYWRKRVSQMIVTRARGKTGLRDVETAPR